MTNMTTWGAPLIKLFSCISPNKNPERIDNSYASNVKRVRYVNNVLLVCVVASSEFCSKLLASPTNKLLYTKIIMKMKITKEIYPVKVFDAKLLFLSLTLKFSVLIFSDNSLKIFSTCPPTFLASVTNKKSLLSDLLPIFSAKISHRIIKTNSPR